MNRPGLLALVLLSVIAGCADDPADTAGTREQLAPGIEYEVLDAAAPGAAPIAAPFVRFEAEVTIDGARVMSSERDGPMTLAVDALETQAPGFARAIAASPVGERRRWWIAPALLQPGFTQSAASAATIELVVLGGRDPIAAPADVAAPPADATVTDSGLAYRRLAAGPDSALRPALTDTVTVHYTGWRAEDGEMFDSSVVRDAPATFPVAGVIAGWTEVLQLMSPGDHVRVWIPGALAYDNSARPGAPKGMLVFDIELLEIAPQP